MNKVAAIQMASGPRRDANLIEARRLLEAAAKAGAKLAVLPEYFAQFSLPEAERIASAEAYGSGPVQEFLAKSAKDFGMWIVGGSLPIKGEGQRVRGACLVYDDKGERVARFDKIHLFDVHIPERNEHYEETSWTEPGSETTVIETPFGRMGVAVCYDLRFPELFRRMQADGAELFALPAAFTATTGRAHWEVLVRARAIENLCYVIAAGQGGYHANGRETFGDSMIVDPWGKVLNRLGNGNRSGSGVVVADLDPVRQQATRKSFPVLEHRRMNESGYFK